MANKLQLYSELAERQAKALTDSREHWTGFLDTAARLYKYPFDEQILIYAQRPDAKACAPLETWNKPMNRFVKRGSKGIALIDSSGTKPQLKYVFDYADTEDGRYNPHRPFVWEMNKENEGIVIEALSRNFDSDIEGDIGTIIFGLANELSARYYNDNRYRMKRPDANEMSGFSQSEKYRATDINYSVEGSFLEDYDELNVGVAFREALTVSAAYSIMARCGIDTNDYIDDEDFQPIFDFNSSDSIYSLGKATSSVSEQVLREIEVTIKKYEVEKTNERGNLYEEHDLPRERGLSDTRYNIDRSYGGNREIRSVEEKLSQESQGNLYNSLLLKEKLFPHLIEIDKTANERLGLMMKEMVTKNPPPDKETDQMGWVAHMNSLKLSVEEIILKELIYS